ncbi:7,8-dihydropterin-6-yl-methyl-4-(beta-D-ribofuranosyl)aminobenzene 5'-phosphate synthase [Acetitomaculum ruminis DSM 5522]|uniref:7,8-dihydropterin-6-yl-methyl-4-(Beta-D-ribofuranosyl)aminobenzene 5'-phosphate synthase n=1 Tax=Acetitomaculum ruminis DSM 5522 TaxID=1120918 RepID=A0A1I1ABK5_9FIRM|nr:MBL fold metallo-hydrolase [Acetitomaculum ruminis]SFB35379.1 7,8-dihydropterin-6-yl-methyl-4-(beta-D-ribofuranosyl)aminobenzene 5'-phosphate synthase [Acetitomaculum ruminis DSM 5522]
MRIINLIENTPGKSECKYEHGLSFYIKTPNHKVLVDFGQSDKFIENARVLGIDLKSIDTAVLSHGHYDHSTGLKSFVKINNSSDIYMQKSVEGKFYADDGEMLLSDRYRYIGIDKEILKLPQVKLLQKDYVIDNELEIFTIKKRTHPLPFTNNRLLIKTEKGYIQDDFEHEHYLLIRENNMTVLISGCAHNGILSILDAYKEKYASLPDFVISGFHLMVKGDYKENELSQVRDIAKKLSQYKTKFFTCHCTGIFAYEEMKKIMGDKLEYIHSGEEVEQSATAFMRK